MSAALAAPSSASACTRTISSPASVQQLVWSLSPGQTGCLRSGDYRGNVYLGTRGVTLTSAPGARAVIEGRVLVEGAGVTVSNLVLDGRTAPLCEPTSDCVVKASPTVYAADVKFVNNEVLNDHKAICFLVGTPGARADRALIRGNRIHDCGRLPATNHDHGIYVVASTGFRITQNTIYDNADRGVQLYPDARGGAVDRNVIDGNGSGLIFGGEGALASSGNVVESNTITNSRIRWNVEEDWPSAVGTGNAVRGNCVFATNPVRAYNVKGGIESPWVGFTGSSNAIADPLYVNRAGKDFRLRAGSPCAGRVPA